MPPKAKINFNPGFMPGGAPKELSRVMFDKFDKDGSGTIDAGEFKFLVYDLGYFLNDTELKTGLQQIDSNGNGSIEYDEFKRWWSGTDRMEKLKLSDEQLAARQKSVEVFQAYDKERKGFIDTKNFPAFYYRLKESGLTSLGQAECLNDLDGNGDGSIQFNEYMDWIMRVGTAKVKVMTEAMIEDVKKKQASA